MPGLAAMVVGVLDGLGLDRVDLLGYSWGGALAQQVAKDAHRRVRRLVLVATIPGLGGMPPPLRVATTMLSPRRFSTPERSWEAAGASTAATTGPTAQNAAPPCGLERQPPSAVGYGQQLLAIAGWTSLPWLHLLRPPTLVISGDDDPLVPAFNARLLAGLIRQSGCIWCRAAGTCWLLDHPPRAPK